MAPILVFTQKDDLHTAAVQKCVERRGETIVLLSREDYGSEWVATWTMCGRDIRAYIDTGTTAIAIDTVRSCWLRRDFTAETTASSPEQAYAASQKAIHINSLLTYMEARIPCMNKPSVNYRAASKILQMATASSCGLSVPVTYTGGDPHRANRFLNSELQGQDVCIKALEAVHFWASDGNAYAHYTSRFRRRPAEDLQTLRDCPVFLQNLVPKALEVRATVVGGSIYAASIDTRGASDDAKVDWRHYDWASTPYYPITLPPEVSARLISVMSSLGLVYGAFDLILTPAGEYVFLEVNSMGQWLWVEELTDLPISDAIARWLIDPVA